MDMVELLPQSEAGHRLCPNHLQLCDKVSGGHSVEDHKECAYDLLANRSANRNIHIVEPT